MPGTYEKLFSVCSCLVSVFGSQREQVELKAGIGMLQRTSLTHKHKQSKRLKACCQDDKTALNWGEAHLG